MEAQKKIPRHDPVLVLREHDERGKWDVLNKHVSTCPACRVERLRGQPLGTGCEVGAACREEWVIAQARLFDQRKKSKRGII